MKPLAESTWEDPRPAPKISEIGYKGSEANYIPTGKETVAAYEGV